MLLLLACLRNHSAPTHMELTAKLKQSRDVQPPLLMNTKAAREPDALSLGPTPTWGNLKTSFFPHVLDLAFYLSH